MKQPLLAIALAGSIGTAAFAGSPAPYIEHVYIDQPPVEQEWKGFYGGLLGGIQNGQIAPGFNFETTNYGAFGGYNFQSGQIVYGAEIDGQVGTINFNPGPTLNIDMLVDAKLRVGYSLGDALVFASGGYTTTGSTTLGTIAAKGWNLGAGLDFAITDSVFVGGEYIYRDLPTTIPGGFHYTSHGAQLRAGLKF